MTHVMMAILSLGGFLLLLLAMARHQQDWLRRKLGPGRSRLLRGAGFLALALSFGVAGLEHGWGHGAVLWFGWLSAGAALTVALNTNRERMMGRKA